MLSQADMAHVLCVLLSLLIGASSVGCAGRPVSSTPLPRPVAGDDAKKVEAYLDWLREDARRASREAAAARETLAPSSEGVAKREAIADQKWAVFRGEWDQLTAMNDPEMLVLGIVLTAGGFAGAGTIAGIAASTEGGLAWIYFSPVPISLISVGIPLIVVGSESSPKAMPSPKVGLGPQGLTLSGSF